MELYTQDQACEILGVSKSTLASWRCSGFGPPYMKASRRSIKYPVAELNEFMRSRIIRSTSQEGALPPYTNSINNNGERE
jgi:hypothetical protein